MFLEKLELLTTEEIFQILKETTTWTWGAITILVFERI